ncbi:type II secretion system F family protein [Antribacter gilvus]|uniref:type II secretion system F family protein n=1 Tax=Antribacter gilvus TaxID=2304675 RepID=UPI000F7B024E|nr:type II secretion system F family protein [Antribacter gilvus]
MSGAWGGLAGLGLAAGLLLVLAGLDARRPRLDARLAPYLRPRDATSALLRADVRVASWSGPVTAAVLRTLERFGSPRDQVRRRLDRAGSRESVDQFRARQLVWSVLGVAAGLGLALLLAATRGSAVVPLVALVLLCGAAGFVACDQVLAQRVRRREERMLAEFPTVADLLALAVAAGEGPVAAIERVATTARGDLADELGRALAAVRAGASVSAALTAMAEQTGLAPLTRFAEGVVVAVERGTPLAEVLRAQAQDVREAGRRALLEAGGRKEVLMMVPVVFLLLPITICFAVFPSLATLHLGF